MFEHLRQWVLRIARVPAAPQPPAGAAASVRVFRAGRNHYRVRLAQWLVAQAATLTGIIFSLLFLQELRLNLEVAQAPAAEERVLAADDVASPDEAAMGAPAAPSRQPRWKAPQVLAERIPTWSVPLVVVAEALGVAAFLLQLPLTFAAVRLDWELRWYIVTDRSLRIRTGIWNLQETTMSFANLQQVEVTQGPLQRLLGLADVRVRSAGGGGGGEGQGSSHHDSLHQGVFQGVEEAAAIRDLILDRLRRYRASGLGDPDDHPDETGAPALARATTALAAAHAVLGEVRALRSVVTASPRPN